MASVGLSLFCVGSTGGRICLVFTSGPHPELRTHSLPGHGCHQGMVQEGHTVPSRTALELPVTGASERMTSWPCHPSLALEPWRNGAGFRARAADVNLKAFMLLSEAALVPSLAFPWWVPGQEARMRSRRPPGVQWRLSEGGSLELHSIGLSQGLQSELRPAWYGCCRRPVGGQTLGG